MMYTVNTQRVARLAFSLAKPLICVVVSVWLALVQPGMSYFWLVNPAVHARLDKELYGQTPDGATLPGHARQLPHQHPAGFGTSVPDLTILNPFDAAFYHTLSGAAQRPALHSRLNEADVSARSVVIKPSPHPPRTSL
jgi:hypothetical protein